MELQRINEELSGYETKSSRRKLTLSSGRRTIQIEADRISHISVEDHYCYFHYRGDAGWHRTDVALPLKEVVDRAPTPFLFVHRSHLVNPAHLKRIKRENRGYKLVLTNEVVLPISRHRLDEVLPKLRAYLAESR